ncbi:hypothetical protein DM02DRAFT_659357 [Periconia macrospinosa]|uniref:Uncharacterized protein n=1 Tax=Periconia macrospinosa TaxID=97972 RepID=A0A2V1DDS2_9PLEO|nr:hypothetical protein DM02DRAFT_659357 [Periconia macrospinosa]
MRALYGKWVVDWNDLFGAVAVIDRECYTSKEYSTLKASWDRFFEIATYREREARQNRMALTGLLESFRHARSTLTRDRFFTLRGLAANSQNLAFEPDYT